MAEFLPLASAIPGALSEIFHFVKGSGKKRVYKGRRLQHKTLERYNKHAMMGGDIPAPFGGDIPAPFGGGRVRTPYGKKVGFGSKAHIAHLKHYFRSKRIHVGKGFWDSLKKHAKTLGHVVKNVAKAGLNKYTTDPKFRERVDHFAHIGAHLLNQKLQGKGKKKVNWSTHGEVMPGERTKITRQERAAERNARFENNKKHAAEQRVERIKAEFWRKHAMKKNKKGGAVIPPAGPLP